MKISTRSELNPRTQSTSRISSIWMKSTRSFSIARTFLNPRKGGEKAYALLHRALARTGKIGIAKVAIWNREYLAAVKPDGLFLVLELMHFAQEILSPEELKGGPDKELTEHELKMAETLIETMSAAWEP